MAKKKGQVHLLDKNKKVIRKMAITSLPYREEIIVDLSIKEFGDSDPCIIHQTYCRNIVGLSLLGDMGDMIGKDIDIKKLPEKLEIMVDIQGIHNMCSEVVEYLRII